MKNVLIQGVLQKEVPGRSADKTWEADKVESELEAPKLCLDFWEVQGQPWQPLISGPLAQVHQEQASDLCAEHRDYIPEKVRQRKANKKDQYQGPVWCGIKAGRELTREQIQLIKAHEQF